MKALRRGSLFPGDTQTPGDLVVLCPACPRPGWNLPDNWRENILRGVLLIRLRKCPVLNPEVSSCSKLLFGYFIAGDGNFKLQLRYKPGSTGVMSTALRMSLFHRGGFWAPIERGQEYLTDAGAFKEVEPKVSFPSLPFVTLPDLLHVQRANATLWLVTQHEP